MKGVYLGMWPLHISNTSNSKLMTNTCNAYIYADRFYIKILSRALWIYTIARQEHLYGCQHNMIPSEAKCNQAESKRLVDIDLHGNEHQPRMHAGWSVRRGLLTICLQSACPSACPSSMQSVPLCGSGAL